PFGCSKRSAGPPAFTVRSTISVTSRSGSTSAATRTSSPSRSRTAIQSRRSFKELTPVAQPVRQLDQRNHRDEDEADDEHRQDSLLAFLRGCLGEELEHQGESIEPARKRRAGAAR